MGFSCDIENIKKERKGNFFSERKKERHEKCDFDIRQCEFNLQTVNERGFKKCFRVVENFQGELFNIFLI